MLSLVEVANNLKIARDCLPKEAHSISTPSTPTMYRLVQGPSLKASTAYPIIECIPDCDISLEEPGPLQLSSWITRDQAQGHSIGTFLPLVHPCRRAMLLVTL